MRDFGIKLFDRNIRLPESLVSPDSVPGEDSPTIVRAAGTFKLVDMENHTCISDNYQSSAEDNIETTNQKSEESKTATFKKPTKMLLCRRCNSTDTKFCYFNIYNVNQPKHFCKSCHRHWTAGGAIRNVPIGASHRKNKHVSILFQHVEVTRNKGQMTQVNLVDVGKDASLSKEVVGTTACAERAKEPSLSGSGMDLSTCRTRGLSQSEQVSFPVSHTSFTHYG